MAETKAALRERQAQGILEALAKRPGLSAYQLGEYIPQPPPLAQRLPLVLSLLKSLCEQGSVRSEADAHGRRWYLAGETSP